MSFSFDMASLAAMERPSSIIPLVFKENVAFRAAFKAWCVTTPDRQRLTADLCARDVLFFINALVWTYDPKRFPNKPYRPFITFPFQSEEVIPAIESSLGKCDLDIVKSRDMGLSWIPGILCGRRLLFFRGQKFTFLSYKKEVVDSGRDPNAIFGKIRIMLKRLPEFMTRDVEDRWGKMQFYKESTDSMISGGYTTEDAGRGGRDTTIVCDEFGAFDRRTANDVLSATEGNTNCRIFISTPKGRGNAFHVISTEGKIPRLDVHWTKHPYHSELLYRALPDQPVEWIDPKWSTATFGWLQDKFPLLSRRIKLAAAHMPLREVYEFVRDGKTRSPYYDHACMRMPYKWMVAQEHDLDFVGSGNPFYDVSMLEEYRAKHSLAPFAIGDLVWDPFTFEPERFVGSVNGPMRLWIHLTPSGMPGNSHRYVMGADIGAGTGASNSCLSIFDIATGVKVLSYVRSDRRPERFAEVAYAIGQWFRFPKVIFEGQGPGSQFRDRLKELNYRSFFKMQLSKDRGEKEEPGLYPNDEIRESVLADYGAALEDGLVTVHDDLAILEGSCYEWAPDGHVRHVNSLTSPDPSGAKKNHSDRWMADALAWHVLKGRRRRKPEKVEDEKELDIGRFRREAEEEEDREVAMADYW